MGRVASVGVYEIVRSDAIESSIFHVFKTRKLPKTFGKGRGPVGDDMDGEATDISTEEDIKLPRGFFLHDGTYIRVVAHA